MENKIKTTPKDVFLHLFNILTFYLSIISFITLYIHYIKALFPDELNYYFSGIANAVRWSSSMLIIAVPAFLLSGWLLSRNYKISPARRELAIRKWLIYFTLFLSAVTVIIDLIIFVYNFFSGELTIQFFLKILVVLIVAAAVFGYYLWDLKRQNLKSRIPRVLAWALVAVTLASVISGFFIVGTPADQRRRLTDERRVSDLQNLQSQVVNYWVQKEALPENLDKLNDSISGFMAPTDPETNQSYEYRIVDLLSFELCADFKTSSDDFLPTVKGVKISSPADPYQQNWNHQANHTCFSRIIDPELYKFQRSDGVDKFLPEIR